MTGSGSSSGIRSAKYMTGLLAAAALVGPAAFVAEAGKVSSAVKVHLPKELARTNGYDHREALFGIPPYGGSIQQTVIYSGADQDLCTPVVNQRWKAPFILLVDRGGCTFVQKVRNAQHAGAAAVIIADNTCQCKHEKTCTPASDQECELHEPIMADDGSGYDITIPSVLLFKQDADPIKAALVKKHSVRMELTWSLPNPDGHVEWDLWTSPTDYVSMNFKKEFRAAVEALGESADLTPHMYVYDGLAAKCRNEDTGESECFNLCTNEGRYCAADPDNDLDYGISGADVVTESVRRLCIWQLYGDDGIGLKWWDYLMGFQEKCDTSEDFMKDNCIRDVMDQIDIEYDAVEQCIFNSGGLDKPEENTILQQQLDDKEQKGIVIMPVVYVNGVAIRGQLEFATIFKAICSGFAPGTEPDICDRCARCIDERKCVLSGSCPAVPGSVKNSTFAGSLLGVTVAFIVIGSLLYVRQQRQMEAQVKGMIREYMPLDVSNGGVAMAEVADTSLEDHDGNFQSSGTLS